MQRRIFIEQIRRIIYGGQPNDESEVTVGLVNSMINPAIAVAAKNNWVESIKIDNVAYISSSFVTSFSGIAISKDDEFGIYNVTLPQIPIGLGRNEGIVAAQVVDSKGVVSKSLVALNLNQVTYADTLPAMNGATYWNEGATLKIKSTQYPLTGYTARVRMVSGGVSDDLDAELSVPPEFIEGMQKYILGMLMPQTPKADLVADGIDKA